MLDITPIFILVSMIISIVLIMFKEWYFEDMGLIMLGISFAQIATLSKDLVPFLWLGVTFMLLGAALGVINIFVVLAKVFGYRIKIDLFH